MIRSRCKAFCALFKKVTVIEGIGRVLVAHTPTSLGRANVAICTLSMLVCWIQYGAACSDAFSTCRFILKNLDKKQEADVKMCGV